MLVRPTPAWSSPELEEFRRSVRHFFETEVVPHRERWETQKYVDRDVFRKAGALGMLATSVPEELGGIGGSYAHEAIIVEEQAYCGDTSFGCVMGSPMALPVLVKYGSYDLITRYMTEIASGDAIVAFALTEPGAGSDIKKLQTTAIRDGDYYILNGQKTFISNGFNADLATVFARTGSKEDGVKGISAFFVDLRGLKGYSVGRILDKVGQKGQDTAELFFEDCRIPADALIGGEEGKGFYQCMQGLQNERTILSLNSLCHAERALQLTLDYTKSREAFGLAIFEMQNTRFRLAELATKLKITRTFIDDCVMKVLDGSLDNTTASMAKYWCTDLLGEVADSCLQFFGGYGYMSEYPISKIWADARIMRIYGGANEVQKEIISRAL